MDGGIGASYQISMGIMKSFCSLFLPVSVPMFLSIVLCMASGKYTTRTLHRPQDIMLHFIDQPDLIFSATTQQLSTVSNVLIFHIRDRHHAARRYMLYPTLPRHRRHASAKNPGTITSPQSHPHPHPHRIAAHLKSTTTKKQRNATQRNANPFLSGFPFPSFAHFLLTPLRP